MATTTMTTVIASHSAGATPSPPRTPKRKKPWEKRLHSLRPGADESQESQERLSTDVTPQTTQGSTASHHKEAWWKVRLFRSMWHDIKRRAPYYASDWRDAWDYRVVPATVYMYFANILPALAFSLDMFNKTNMSFGVNEVLLASVLGAVVFSVFAAQPLVIVGVTGPITVFSYTVYDIVVPQGINYFAFMAWIGLWSLVMHWILAITNACNFLTYVTRFSCDTFGFYVAAIYLQKGIQVLTRQWQVNDASAYLSIMVALLVTALAYICGIIGNSNLFQRYVRKFIEDYGTPLTVIFFTGFVHIGRMRSIDLQKLPTSKAFSPTQDRGWFIDFWDIRVGDIFLAVPFALLLTILFYFDHNVSSLIAQGTEFPLRKPAGFHWDMFLLGLTTGVAGLLGIPFPNGLIPQAPFHTNSLCVTHQVADKDEKGANKGHTVRVVDHVVEQRVSNLAQGLLTLGTMTGPLLVVLHLIPQGVLAGLFFVMGIQALESNGITAKLVWICKDKALVGAADPLGRVERKNAICLFTAMELVGFGATFAITQTIAAIGFPIIILALIPVRTFLLPRYFTKQELAVLDAPTASAFTMESVGGNYGEERGEIGVAGEDDNTGPVLPTTEAEGSGNNSSGEDPINAGTVRQISQGGLDPLGRGCEDLHPDREGKHANRRKSFRSAENEGGDAIEMRTNLRRHGNKSS